MKHGDLPLVVTDRGAAAIEKEYEARDTLSRTLGAAFLAVATLGVWAYLKFKGVG